MQEYEKYLKSIAKSLEIIAKTMDEDNKRQKEEMKNQIEKEKEDKMDAINTANEIIAYLESENIKLSTTQKDEITSSLSE
jgi:beta-phosphoglucomutase-like phosphatase (HAD superfamily)